MKRIAPAPALELRDLRLVLALASGGTTARAATLLHLSQPAASRALVTLEHRLGTALFERTRRGLRPTKEGERLVERAGELLAEVAGLEAELRADRVTPTRLRVVCECYTAYHWIPSALAELRTLHPSIRFDLAVGHTRDPARGLESGEVDLALVTCAELDPAIYEQRRLFSDPVVFLLGRGHPLASKAALTPEDLESNPILTNELPPSEARWFHGRVFGRRRAKLRVQQLPLTEAVVDFARAGLGIGVLSEWVVTPHLGRGDLVVKRLEGCSLDRPWRLAYRPEHRAIARALVGPLRATAPQTTI